MVDTPDSKLIQKIKKENPDLPFEDILKIAKSQKSNNKKPNSKGIDKPVTNGGQILSPI